MARTTLSTAQLYAVLDREFRKRKPAACVACSVPLPYWCPAPDEVSANWMIGTPRVCQHRCHIVIAELVTFLWSRYDLIAPVGRDSPRPTRRSP